MDNQNQGSWQPQQPQQPQQGQWQPQQPQQNQWQPQQPQQGQWQPQQPQQGQWQPQQPQQGQWQPQQPQQNQWQQQQPQQNQWQPQQPQQNQWQQQQQHQEPWANPQPQYQDQNGNWQNNPNYPNPTLGTVGFIEAIKTCFMKYANFSGRASRAEFWWWQLAVFIGCCIPLLNYAVILGTIVPSLAVTWRRLHDIGKSGGFYFMGFIPIAGAIILIINFCKIGEPHPNRFGPNPYGIDDGEQPMM